jgi:hypothetical protein
LNAGGPFTEDELKAFAALFEYVDCEREDYEGRPAEGHIWLEIAKAMVALARVRGLEQKATEGTKV